MPETMKFGDALELLREGYKVYRLAWMNVKYIDIQSPYTSRMTQPYIYCETTSEDYLPWTPSQADLFADDWQRYEE